MIGSFGTHIWESFFLYLHPVMGVGFHLHIITICSLLQERFYIDSFCVPRTMKEPCEEQYELTIMLNLL